MARREDEKPGGDAGAASTPPPDGPGVGEATQWNGEDKPETASGGAAQPPEDPMLRRVKLTLHRGENDKNKTHQSFQTIGQPNVLVPFDVEVEVPGWVVEIMRNARYNVVYSGDDGELVEESVRRFSGSVEK